MPGPNRDLGLVDRGFENVQRFDLKPSCMLPPPGPPPNSPVFTPPTTATCAHTSATQFPHAAPKASPRSVTQIRHLDQSPRSVTQNYHPGWSIESATQISHSPANQPSRIAHARPSQPALPQPSNPQQLSQRTRSLPPRISPPPHPPAPSPERPWAGVVTSLMEAPHYRPSSPAGHTAASSGPRACPWKAPSESSRC